MPWTLPGRLPLSWLYGLSRLLYLLLYHLIRYRRGVVRGNLREAFPAKSAAELKGLEKAYYRHLGDVAVEILYAQRMTGSEYRERVILANSPALQELADAGPVIILTLHKGNCEWALHALSLQLSRVFDPVYKPPHNRRLGDFLHAIRSRYGATPIPTSPGGGPLRRALRRGSSLCILADQSPTMAQPGRTFNFMNRETRFHTGVEDLARLSQYPVFFADMSRIRRGHYQVEFTQLMSAGEDPGVADLTKNYVSACERAILRQPESWLWSHQRWRQETRQSAEVQPVKTL